MQNAIDWCTLGESFKDKPSKGAVHTLVFHSGGASITFTNMVIFLERYANLVLRFSYLYGSHFSVPIHMTHICSFDDLTRSRHPAHRITAHKYYLLLTVT
jgi:hypothetical protein